MFPATHGVLSQVRAAGGGGGGGCDREFIATSQGWSSTSSGIQVGNEFTVGASDITVCALSFRNSPAATEEELRLWRVSDQALLAQATTTPGDPTDWKTVSIAPVTLIAGESYVVTMRRANGSTRTTYRIAAADIAANATFDPAVTFVRSRFVSGTGYPSSTLTYLYGTNFTFGLGSPEALEDGPVEP